MTSNAVLWSTESFLTGAAGNTWQDICCLKGTITSVSSSVELELMFKAQGVASSLGGRVQSLPVVCNASRSLFLMNCCVCRLTAVVALPFYCASLIETVQVIIDY